VYAGAVSGAWRQWAAIALALASWSVVASPALWTLLLAYVCACFVLGATPLHAWLEALPKPARAGLLALLTLPALGALVRVWPTLVENEGIASAWPGFVDRLRLERDPSIAPPLVSAAQPQAFFVHAGAGTTVRVQLASGIRVLDATDLGAGLFRIDYDPRRDGVPRPANGAIEATLWVDGAAHARTLRAATPLAHPRWFARAPSARLAATVSEETDELIVVSARGLERRLPVGDGPRDCAFLDDARIAVSHRFDPRLWVIDAHGFEVVARVVVGEGGGRLAVSPSGRLLALTAGGKEPSVSLLDARDLALVARGVVPHAADAVAFGGDDDTLLVTTPDDARLVRLGREGRALVPSAALALSRPATALARVDDGRRLLLAVTDYRADGTAQLGNHFVQDQLLAVDSATLRVEARLLTARRSARQSRAGDVDRGLSPLGIAQAGDGTLLIAFAGSDELWRLGTLHGEPEILDLPAGVEDEGALVAPHGVVELADGTVLVASPASGTIGTLRRGAVELGVVRLAPTDAQLLKRDSTALAQRLGERGFYEGTRAGVSCQSCHLHADSDGASYNLGDHELVPTLSVRGLLGTAPYLRDGSYPTLADLDDVAQSRYRGYLRRAPGRPTTLEAYLESLPRAASPQADLATQRRGAQVFVQASCATCHSFPAFTSLAQHRAVEVFPGHASAGRDSLLDVPSLLSVGSSAPYLSDGRAPTLAAVLTEHNRQNHHGDTAKLSASERADLIAFLEAL
jgi:hypothetical protein